MATCLYNRRRETRKFDNKGLFFKITLIMVVLVLLLGVLSIPFNFLHLNDKEENTSQKNENAINLENDQKNLASLKSIPEPGMEWGYEVVPPAPEVSWESLSPEPPHPDGIPPITDRYKNPDYLKSRTRSGGPNVVNETVLLILVNFSDNKSFRPVKELEDMVYNTSANALSMHNYYEEVSYGACNIQPGYIIGAAGGAWLKIPQIRKYYGQDNHTTGLRDDGMINDDSWLTSGKGQLVKDALAAADNAGVDFSKYDNDGPDGVPNSADDDGNVDHVLIIYSGNGQNHYGTDTVENPGPDDDGGINDYGRDLIWPSRLSAPGWFGTYDGKPVNSVTVNPEDPSFTLPLGVTCHEFGHDLGLPDLYNIDTGNSVVGNWEVMDMGNYNTNSTGAPRPAHFSAWCKVQLGWIQPIVINETNNNQGMVQVNQTTSPTNDTVCYRVDIEGENEYFLVENRNTTVGTFEEGLPDRGILIWHIDEDMQVNRIILPTYPYYAIYLEDYKNNLNAENYIIGRNSATWKSGGAADQADFNVSTAPNTSANGGSPSTIYLDRIQDNALWNMTVRILVKDDMDPPGAPQNVQAIDAANDNGETINLTWDKSADDGSGDADVLGYNIYMNGSAGIGAPKVLVKIIDATGAGSYKTQVTNLIDGIMYNFTVLADDGPNVSPFPGNYTATPFDNIARSVSSLNAEDTNPDDGENITLTWILSEDDPIGNASGPSDIIWYNISINDSGQGEGGTKHLLVSLGPGNDTYKVGNLTNNLPHYFTITAVDDVFNKDYSLEVNATPTDDYIGSPQNIRATPNSWYNASNFLIEWVNPYDNANILEAYYKLDSAPTSNADFTGNITGFDIDFVLVNDALTDGVHPVYVWLRDGENNRNYSTAASVNIFYDATPPGSPIGLSATPATWSTSNSFTFTWVNPSEISGIKGVFFSIDSPPTYFNDGFYQQGLNLNQLSGITVPGQGKHTIYIWLLDNAYNVDHNTYVTVDVYYDSFSPGKPMDIQATPDTWTNINSFDITWTNPTDVSGIIGAWYQLDTFPSDNDDGIFVAGDNISSIQDISVSGTGTHVLYLWLVDNASNSNYLADNYTLLYYDINPPPPPNYLQAFPTYWTTNNSFYVNWTNPGDHSGIWGVYYKIGSPPTSYDDGIYIAGDDIEEISDIKVLENGSNDLYVWLHDMPGNTNHLNYSYTQLFYDALAPDPPEQLTPFPTNIWTSNNSFDISWNNPTTEYSGVAAAYYKLDSPPTSNTDGVIVKRLGISYIEDIKVTGSGAHKIYVWLVDRVDNVNFLNYSVTELLFDDTPPGPPINLTIVPSQWVDTNMFDIHWTNPPEHSGIYGLYYWFSAPTENIGKLEMGYDISRLHNISIPGQGEYTIYLWLIDNAYNMDYRNNATQKLRFDQSPPTFIHSRILYATKGLPVTITTIASDHYSGVKEVKLFYKHESDSTYEEQLMERTGSLYTGVIPSEFVTDETIGYYLYASDKTNKPQVIYYGANGHTTYKPGSTTDIDITITEEDVMPPIIVHQKITTGTAGVMIGLTAIVTDDGSGVKEVKCFYRTKGASGFNEGLMINGKPYYFSIPAHVVTTAGVEYYLYAKDNSPRNNYLFFGRDGLTNIDPVTDNRYIEIEVTVSDDRPPQIIYGPEAINISSTSAIIYWITDEPANSVVDYGLTEIYIHKETGNSYITIHSIKLDSLTVETTYYFRVSSTDQNNNGPTYSENSQFKTVKEGEADSDGDGISDAIDPDDDNDNMPDSWEIENGFDPKDPADANLDSDNDGYSNLREYLAGSDPNDDKSNPLSIKDTKSPIIIHEPVTRVEKYHPVIITAAVYDNGSGVKTVKLYYRHRSETIYKAINMTKSGDQTYTFELSGAEVTKDIGYYLEATDGAFVPNVIYFGKSGLTVTRPTSDSDIDIDVFDKTKDEDQDDDDVLGDLGKPFGIDNAGICLLVIVIAIVLIICFILVLRSAMHARAIAKHSAKHTSTTADGDRITWEGDEFEELDEVEDLAPSDDYGESDEIDGI